MIISLYFRTKETPSNLPHAIPCSSIATAYAVCLAFEESKTILSWTLSSDTKTKHPSEMFKWKEDFSKYIDFEAFFSTCY